MSLDHAPAWDGDRWFCDECGADLGDDPDAPDLSDECGADGHAWPGDDSEGYPDDDGRCQRCGGEGFVEYDDAPETWGEDSPSEINHLVECPECGGEG